MKMRFTLLVVLALALMLAAPAFATSVLYTNGPLSGAVTAYYIDFGYSVSDSFTVSGSTITAFSAGLWVVTGQVPASLNWAIGTSPFASDIASGSASLLNSYLGSYYYDYYDSLANGLNVVVGAGTYWLSLSNGATAGGSWLAWDVNNGPSSAMHSLIGPISSEAFTVYGTTPEPGTILMLGSGALGLAGMLRRKLSL